MRPGAGIAAGLVSIPNRYLQGPIEIIRILDLEGAARVIAVFVNSVSRDSDFRLQSAGQVLPTACFVLIRGTCWQRGQKYVPRPPTRVFSIGVPQ